MKVKIINTQSNEGMSWARQSAITVLLLSLFLFFIFVASILLFDDSPDLIGWATAVVIFILITMVEKRIFLKNNQQTRK